MSALLILIALSAVCYAVYYLAKIVFSHPSKELLSTSGNQKRSSTGRSHNASSHEKSALKSSAASSSSIDDADDDFDYDQYCTYKSVETKYADKLIRCAKDSLESNLSVEEEISVLEEMVRIYDAFKEECRKTSTYVYDQFCRFWSKGYIERYKAKLEYLKKYRHKFTHANSYLDNYDTETAEKVMVELQKHSGIKQTEFYSLFDPSKKQAISRHLYALDSSGAIWREKDGSSYRLYYEKPIGSAEKPKKPRQDKDSLSVPTVAAFDLDTAVQRVNEAKAALSTDELAFCNAFVDKLYRKAMGEALPTFNVHSELPLHMISVRNKAILPMLHYPHFENLSFLDEKELPFAFLMMYQAGRKMNKDIGYQANGVTQALFPDMDKAIQMLWAMGFLQEDTAENILNGSTLAELQSILRAENVPVPKTKPLCVAAMMERFDDDSIRRLLAHNVRFFPSPLGYCLIHSLYYEMGLQYEVEAVAAEPGITPLGLHSLDLFQKQTLSQSSH